MDKDTDNCNLQSTDYPHRTVQSHLWRGSLNNSNIVEVGAPITNGGHDQLRCVNNINKWLLFDYKSHNLNLSCLVITLVQLPLFQFSVTGMKWLGK